VSATVEERGDAHEWTLEGHRLSELAIDREGLRLQSWSMTESIHLRVLVPFRYAQADGSDRLVDPREPEQLSPLLSLLGRLVLGVRVAGDGTLVVRFGDGSVLTCAAHATRDAWELQGAGALEGLAYRAHAGGGAPWG
jgi:hypothetical protein